MRVRSGLADPSLQDSQVYSLDRRRSSLLSTKIYVKEGSPTSTPIWNAELDRVEKDLGADEKMAPKMPSYVRQMFAEFLGTFALVLIGDGAVAQVVLGGALKTDGFFGGFLNIALGYGLALMVGIILSGGVSGGHLNPAVTVAMAVIKKLKVQQIPFYFAGQYLGAFTAALVLWGTYADGINIAEVNGSYTGATSGIFSSFPFSEKTSLVVLAMDQMLGTAMLLLIILGVTDSRNMQISASCVPLLIGLGLSALHLSFGLNAGCAINPARDFAPRLLTLIAGWGTQPFTAFGNWFWIPWLLPHIGGVVGALTYTLLIEMHHPADNLKL